MLKLDASLKLDDAGNPFEVELYVECPDIGDIVAEILHAAKGADSPEAEAAYIIAERERARHHRAASAESAACAGQAIDVSTLIRFLMAVGAPYIMAEAAKHGAHMHPAGEQPGGVQAGEQPDGGECPTTGRPCERSCRTLCSIVSESLDKPAEQPAGEQPGDGMAGPLLAPQAQPGANPIMAFLASPPAAFVPPQQ